MSTRRIPVIRAILLAVTIILIVTFACNVWVISSTRNSLFANIDNIPRNTTGLLLSTTGKYDNDNTTRLLAENRIRATMDLYSAKKISHILVSGLRTATSNEQLNDRYALAAQEISDSVITVDYSGSGSDLYSVLHHLQRTYGLDSLTVITDPSCINRVVFVCRQLGISAVAYCPEKLPWQYTWRHEGRELLANVYTVASAYLF